MSFAGTTTHGQKAKFPGTEQFTIPVTFLHFALCFLRVNRANFHVQCPVPFLHFCRTGIGKCTRKFSLLDFAGYLGFLPDTHFYSQMKPHIKRHAIVFPMHSLLDELNEHTYKWKNHFSEMKGDVGMSLHEKEGEQEDA